MFALHIEFPFVFLDATYVKAQGGRVAAKAVIVATGSPPTSTARYSVWPWRQAVQGILDGVPLLRSRGLATSP